MQVAGALTSPESEATYDIYVPARATLRIEGSADILARDTTGGWQTILSIDPAVYTLLGDYYGGPYVDQKFSGHWNQGETGGVVTLRVHQQYGTQVTYRFVASLAATTDTGPGCEGEPSTSATTQPTTSNPPISTPTSTPGPTSTTPPTLAPRTYGDFRVGATWGVRGVPTAGATYAWLGCHSLSTTDCTYIPGAQSSTYRVTRENLERFVAVEVRLPDGRVARSTPRFVLQDVCLVPIEFRDGHYYSTRTRDSTWITPRPGLGCLRINLFIAARKIDLLGYGNNRRPSHTADASESKGSIWINFETGRVDVVANHSRTDLHTFNAFRSNVAVNPDASVLEALVGCIRYEADPMLYDYLDEACQQRTFERHRRPNHAGLYFPSEDTGKGENFRIRYHFTNAAKKLGVGPSAIDGIFEVSSTPDGRLDITCAFTDRFPTIEIYQDHPSPNVGADYTLRRLYLQRETTPRALDADAPKHRHGTCGAYPRPAIDGEALGKLRGVLASSNGLWYPIEDPYSTLLRDLRPWPPM